MEIVAGNDDDEKEAEAAKWEELSKIVSAATVADSRLRFDEAFCWRNAGEATSGDDVFDLIGDASGLLWR